MSYESKLDLIQTEKAIKFVKDHFEAELSRELELTRVSAPLFVLESSGLNDNLNGIERSVSFDIKETGKVAEVVHSLAKWKRHALGRYRFRIGTGIYTDMNAIRRDEVCDAIHSIYVDQWDWEKVIRREDRTLDYLRATVRQIYSVIYKVSRMVMEKYPQINVDIPPDIAFVSTQELEDTYPNLTPKQREDAIAKKYGAVFLIGIGGKLKGSGAPHDGRAPDYDDWKLNGDILIYYKPIGGALELSSMGIRVDADSLLAQLKETGKEDRLSFPFHKALLADELPLTIGGGIGQSRLCMFMLNKAHIGEVQSSIWPEQMLAECEKKNIIIL
ncbi:aspartate--ammonia ligase [Ruminococcaceae bacterium OttesenSCG-928-I18]|nr:aspartate--ammonia ligase [Ruminococcaceae bacterium OttesenSCG-928-I18]